MRRTGDHRRGRRRPAGLQRGPHASSPSSTARSTTSRNCARSCARRDTGSARTATPSAWSTSTRSTATSWSTDCAACSPSPSGTRRGGGCCSPATAWARSRCTGGMPADRLAFASELKALMPYPVCRREVDPVALHHYLTYQYVPAPWSIHRGVRKLPPGHLLVWQGGRVSVRRYWALDFTPGAGSSTSRRPWNGPANCCWTPPGSVWSANAPGRVPVRRDRLVRSRGRHGAAECTNP